MNKGRYFFVFLPKISTWLKDFTIVSITIIKTIDILTNQFLNQGKIINSQYCLQNWLYK